MIASNGKKLKLLFAGLDDLINLKSEIQYIIINEKEISYSHVEYY